MKYEVFYFTRTGVSKRVAEKIGELLLCEPIEITDDMDWSGASGFLKGGYYASRKKSVQIKLSKPSEGKDILVVVTPLWAGKIAPAIDAFLKKQDLKKVHLVVTSSGSTLKERQGYCSITDIVKNRNDEAECIQTLVSKLTE